MVETLYVLLKNLQHSYNVVSSSSSVYRQDMPTLTALHLHIMTDAQVVVLLPIALVEGLLETMYVPSFIK